ncbi:hypothetical protein AVEN_272968-1, partial [Araneus ventricosus]
WIRVGVVAISVLRTEDRGSSSKPDSTEDPSCMGPNVLSSRWCGVEDWRGGASSGVVLSPDRGSKLRGPSQNSLRVAAKQDVNITKLVDPRPVPPIFRDICELDVH